MREANDSVDGLETLRERVPNPVFLALGQTALWDEPTKAALVRRLKDSWPEARFVAGVHDTDYFAKLPGHPASASDSPYARVPHDDWTTRGLWSAAGEMHALFGSEDVPTRALLAGQGGVALHRVTAFVDDPDRTLADLTAAAGWSGLIRTGWKREVVADVRLDRILPALLEQIDWALAASGSCIEGGSDPAAVPLRAWVEEFARQNPDATLPDLYTDLLPRLHGLLLGREPGVETTRTTELLRCNRATASLPRFAFADLFLNSETRQRAVDAYNLAVAGSDIYTLDRFGEGALPFEIAVPGAGRGTLRVADGQVRIDTPHPIVLDGAPTSVAELAALLEDALGPDCTLLGKAVSLLPLLAAEFVFVFHDGASGYSGRTRHMVEAMAARGLDVPTLHPILRVRYHTWDALDAVSDVVFRLPENLSQALGRPVVAADDLAACWERGVAWERTRLAELSRLNAPRALLEHLARAGDPRWGDALARHDAATRTLLDERARAADLHARVHALYDDIRALKAEAAALERAKGDDFRARGGRIDPDAAAERAARFDQPVAALRTRVRDAQAQARALKAARKAIEWGAPVVAARETLRRVEADAERERARQAAHALRTLHGMPHAERRPTAWWFPLVDPSGAWFSRVADTARYRLEPLAP